MNFCTKMRNVMMKEIIWNGAVIIEIELRMRKNFKMINSK
jgi:hypothetical protein